MARRIIVHFLTECDGIGCHEAQTRLGEATLESAATPLRGEKLLVKKQAPGEAPNPGFKPIRINGKVLTLCPACVVKLQGVFQADIGEIAPEPPPFPPPRVWNAAEQAFIDDVPR